MSLEKLSGKKYTKEKGNPRIDSPTFIFSMLVGLCMIIISLLILFISIRPFTEFKETTARLIGGDRPLRNDETGLTWYVDGKEYTTTKFYNNLNKTYVDPAIGSYTMIEYEVKNPEKIRIVTWHKVGVIILFFSVGAALCVGSIVFFVRKKQREKKRGF